MTSLLVKLLLKYYSYTFKQYALGESNNIFIIFFDSLKNNVVDLNRLNKSISLQTIYYLLCVVYILSFIEK